MLFQTNGGYFVSHRVLDNKDHFHLRNCKCDSCCSLRKDPWSMTIMALLCGPTYVYEKSYVTQTREWKIYRGEISPQPGEIEVGTKFHTLIIRMEKLAEFEIWRQHHEHEIKIKEQHHREKTLAQVESFKQRIGGEHATLYDVKPQ